MIVKAHPANVGKRVRATYQRNGQPWVREGTILRFRGGFASRTSKPHAAFVKWDTAYGFQVMSVVLKVLEYV